MKSFNQYEQNFPENLDKMKEENYDVTCRYFFAKKCLTRGLNNYLGESDDPDDARYDFYNCDSKNHDECEHFRFKQELEAKLKNGD